MMARYWLWSKTSWKKRPLPVITIVGSAKVFFFNYGRFQRVYEETRFLQITQNHCFWAQEIFIWQVSQAQAQQSRQDSLNPRPLFSHQAKSSFLCQKPRLWPGRHSQSLWLDWFRPLYGGMPQSRQQKVVHIQRLISLWKQFQTKLWKFKSLLAFLCKKRHCMNHKASYFNMIIFSFLFLCSTYVWLKL